MTLYAHDPLLDRPCLRWTNSANLERVAIGADNVLALSAADVRRGLHASRSEPPLDRIRQSKLGHAVSSKLVQVDVFLQLLQSRGTVSLLILLNLNAPPCDVVDLRLQALLRGLKLR